MAETGQERRRCAWRCSARCGWSSTVRRSRSPDPSAARCSRSSRSPRAGPSAWTAWWTPCGRPRCRTPGGRPCTPTSPGCARTSGRRRAGCRPATTATGSTSPPTSSTSRRRGPCSRRPAPHPADALAVLQEAHGLWRGPVLADLTDIEPIAVAVAGCAQLHRELTDALISCAVDAGRAGDVVALAAAAHADDPLREPAVLLLMRALAATGQAPEALRIGREYRRRLADETGLDPSPALAERERDIAGGGADRPRPTAARPTTRLIGREAQVAALHRLLGAERWVTIVGAGGVGKTRVALEVAQRSEAPIVLLLAPVTDPAAIPHALASALNLQVVQGDVLAACVALPRRAPRAAGGRQLRAPARRGARDGHRAPVGVPAAVGAGHQPRAARATRGVHLPAGDAPASRARTRRTRPGLRRCAVFLDRARRVRPGPPPTAAELRLVADIVRRLDGLPLAIELAAGRLSGLSLVDLHRRLDRALDLLGGRTGGGARHRTLRATVEWSYQLLDDDERRLFRYLSVFADGIALDDAERLATDLGPGGRPRHGAVPAGRHVHARRRVRRGRHPVPDAGDAAGVRPRPARRRGRGRRRGGPPAPVGGRPRDLDRRDAADGARARGGRGPAPRDGEPADGVAAGPQPRERRCGRRRSSSRCSTRSATGTWWRSADWAEELARRPVARAHPERGGRAGHGRARRPTTAGTTRGPSDSAARGSNARSDDAASWYCTAAARRGRPGSRSARRGRRALHRDGRAGDPGGRDAGRRRRWPPPTPATSTGRGSCTREDMPDAVSPTMRAWSDVRGRGDRERRRARRAGRAALPARRSTWPAGRARPSWSASRPSAC